MYVNNINKVKKGFVMENLIEIFEKRFVDTFLKTDYIKEVKDDIRKNGIKFNSKDIAQIKNAVKRRVLDVTIEDILDSDDMHKYIQDTIVNSSEFKEFIIKEAKSTILTNSIWNFIDDDHSLGKAIIDVVVKKLKKS